MSNHWRPAQERVGLHPQARPPFCRTAGLPWAPTALASTHFTEEAPKGGEWEPRESARPGAQCPLTRVRGHTGSGNPAGEPLSSLPAEKEGPFKGLEWALGTSALLQLLPECLS